VETLPDFDSRGALPPGIHACTWDAFALRFATTPHRSALLEGLRRALRALGAAGCAAVYVDGSFITARTHPADFDACWDLAGVDLAAVPPVFWDFENDRAAQRAAFGGELFLMDWPAAPGETFLEFFQHDRDGLPKGIVRLDPREVS
jgi:hypothetical protein